MEYTSKIQSAAAPRIQWITRERAILIGLFAAAIVLRLIAAPLWSHPFDTKVFIQWAQKIQHYGLLHVYQKSTANYPPLGMAVIGFSAWLAKIFNAGKNLQVWRVLIK